MSIIKISFRAHVKSLFSYCCRMSWIRPQNSLKNSLEINLVSADQHAVILQFSSRITMILQVNWYAVILQLLTRTKINIQLKLREVILSVLSCTTKILQVNQQEVILQFLSRITMILHVNLRALILQFLFLSHITMILQVNRRNVILKILLRITMILQVNYYAVIFQFVSRITMILNVKKRTLILKLLSRMMKILQDLSGYQHSDFVHASCHFCCTIHLLKQLGISILSLLFKHCFSQIKCSCSFLTIQKQESKPSKHTVQGKYMYCKYTRLGNFQDL